MGHVVQLELTCCENDVRPLDELLLVSPPVAEPRLHPRALQGPKDQSQDCQELLDSFKKFTKKRILNVTLTVRCGFPNEPLLIGLVGHVVAPHERVV